MLGRARHLRSAGRRRPLETSCPDCGEPAAVDLPGERAGDESLLVHCLVPDCALAGGHSRWLGGRPPGATISAAKLSELAHAWRDDRISLSPDREPHTREQNQAILERLGLTREFWQLARGRHPAGPLQSAEHEPL